MKTNFIGVILLMGVGGMIVYTLLWGTTSVEYNSSTSTSTVETVEVLPEWAEDEDAKAAAQAVIRKKELQAELAQLEGEVQERQTRIDEIEKELSL